MRLIILSEGNGMGDYVSIFRTDAPQEELKRLETISQAAEEPPIWATILRDKGFTFDFVDECRNVTPYTKSSDWMINNYATVNESYCLEV